MRKTCSCGNAWADEPGHDFDLEDVAEEWSESLDNAFEDEWSETLAKEDARNAYLSE